MGVVGASESFQCDACPGGGERDERDVGFYQMGRQWEEEGWEEARREIQSDELVAFDIGGRRVLARVGTAEPERVCLFERTILAQADGGGEEGVGGGASLWCVGGGGGGGWSGGERATLSWFGLGEGVCRWSVSKVAGSGDEYCSSVIQVVFGMGSGEDGVMGEH